MKSWEYIKLKEMVKKTTKLQDGGREFTKQWRRLGVKNIGGKNDEGDNKRG